jgi:hypothetical protein
METLTIPEKISAPTWVLIAGGLALCIGAATFAYALMNGHPQEAWGGYLIGSWFLLSLGVFGTLWVSTLYLSRGIWSVTMRRIPEAMGAAILPGSILVMLVTFGMHDLYHWTHVEAVAADELLIHKSTFLNMNLFWILMSACIAIWLIFQFVIVRNSSKQDETGSSALTFRNNMLSALFVLLYALTYSIASIYFLMSLEPHWYSTIFAVLTFTDMFQTGTAVVTLIASVFVLNGILKEYLNENHLHGIGKMMFAATGFWAYIYFCQYLLIWYANLPEEVAYFARRYDGGWVIYLAVLPLLKFIIPFIYLAPRNNKRKPKRLIAMAVLIIFAQFYELFIMVAPALGHGEHAAHGHLPIIEGLIWLGFVGIFVITFALAFRRRTPVPIKDPWLRESLHHHT